jgi:tetratricopeptide (TPR) repeat protein
VAAIEEALALAARSREPALRIAVLAAGAYAFMCAGDLDRVEATADELLELTATEPDLGAGLVIASPRAWALTAKAMARRERDEDVDAEALIDAALAESSARGDLETESWALGLKAQLIADRGDTEAALALALRNRELSDRLGDVFSQTVALTMLAYVRVEAGEFEAALAEIERAEREYREAMGAGGEMEAWRGTLRTKALLGCGRAEEALAAAEAAVAPARKQELGWPLPITLHCLASARAALGREGVVAALDEAAALARADGHLMLLRRIEEARPGLVAA